MAKRQKIEDIKALMEQYGGGEDSSDGDDSSEQSSTASGQLMKIEFEGFTAEDMDCPGIQLLLGQNLRGLEDVDVGGLADIVVQQNYVGCVIKEVAVDEREEREAMTVDEDGLEDDDFVYGVNTVVNITHRRSEACVEQLVSALWRRCAGSGASEASKQLVRTALRVEDTQALQNGLGQDEQEPMDQQEGQAQQKQPLTLKQKLDQTKRRLQQHTARQKQRLEKQKLAKDEWEQKQKQKKEGGGQDDGHDMDGDEKEDVGLLINERMVNLPQELAIPAFTSLIPEIVEVQKLGMPYNFKYLLLIAKTRKITTQTNAKKTVEEVWTNTEEEVFLEFAVADFEYCVDDSSTVTDQVRNFRRVLLIPADKLAPAVDKMVQS